MNTKKCPMCAEEIKLEARVCRYCGARFMVRESGYCQNCHRLVNIDPTGKCTTCSGEVVDRHIVSALINESVPVSAPPAEIKPVVPDIPPPVQGVKRMAVPVGFFQKISSRLLAGSKSAPGVMDFWQLYFLPQGRIGRKTFMLEGLLPQVVLCTLLVFIIISLGGSGVKTSIFWTILTVLAALVLLWVLVMLLVKRLHDLNRSGWRTLYWLAPNAGMLLLNLLFPAMEAGSVGFSILISMLSMVAFLVQLIRCIFTKGDDYTNKYGQEPEWLPASRVVSSPAVTLSVKDSLYQRRVMVASVLTLFLVPLALFSLVRFFVDQNNLKQGMKAFEQADCVTATSRFEKVIQSWRLLDFGGIKAKALTKQESCRPFLYAVERQEAGEYANALSEFTDLALGDSTDPVLAQAARERIGSLFEGRQLSELTSIESCQKLADIQSAGLIPQPDVRLPELYFACATEYQAGGRDGDAVRVYGQLLVEYPSHERTDEAERALLSNTAACGQVGSLAKEPNLVARGDFVVELYYGCGQMYDSEKKSSNAFDMYKRILIDYPGHALAVNAERAVLANPVSCEHVSSLQSESAIATRDDLMPSLLFGCGQGYENKNQYQNAVEMYETFLEYYPNNTLASDVNTALARALVNAARAAGAGEISAPPRSGNTTGGSTLVIIQNDSPEKLRIVFSGPEARIVELSSCSQCTTYLISPFSCPELGPIGRYTLQPGTYDVLVESISDSGVTPYTGSWSLVDGDEYSSCFFIIQQYQFNP